MAAPRQGWRRWLRRGEGEGGGDGGGAERAAAMAAARQGRRRWWGGEGSKANNMIFDSTGGGDVYIRIYIGGGRLYSINTSIVSQVWYMSPNIQFYMKGEHVKSILHEFGTCKIDFTYIRYYLAAKIDFTGFPILAAPDLSKMH